MYAAAQGPRATIRVTPGAGLTFNGIAQATTSDILTCKVRVHIRAPQVHHSRQIYGLGRGAVGVVLCPDATHLVALVGTSLLCPICDTTAPRISITAAGQYYWRRRGADATKLRHRPDPAAMGPQPRCHCRCTLHNPGGIAVLTSCQAARESVRTRSCCAAM